MNYYLDSVFYRDGKMNLIGWAVPATKGNRILFRAFSSAGKELPVSVWHSARPDIGFGFFREPGIPDLGFYLQFACEEHETVTLELNELMTKNDAPETDRKPDADAADEIVASERTPVSLSRFALREKLKEMKGTLRKPYRFAKNVRDKITKKPEKKYRAYFLRHRVSEEEAFAQCGTVFPDMPVISVLVPVYFTPARFLREMIESVLGQTYAKWELILTNAGMDSAGAAVLSEYAEKDARIRVIELSENQGISGNTNAAFTEATGEFIALLDHDDLLERDALFEYVKALNEDPTADVFYSDEDKVTEASTDYFFPNYKPDFNPDMLRANNYICHFLCIRADVIRKAGGWDASCDGAQDHDLLLRCTQFARKFVHIPRVLYHWRCSKTSTASDLKNKDYALLAGVRAVERDLKRRGFTGTVRLGQVPGWYQTEIDLKEEPLVSVLIPNKDHPDDLKQCIASLYKEGAYPNIEVLVIENNSTEEATFSCYEELKKQYPSVRVIRFEGGFNFSAINNLGAREAKGEYLLLLNNDVEAITPDFIRSMLSYAQRDDVGCVGAKLLYADDTVQHAGVLVGAGGVASHMFKGLPDNDPGYMCRPIMTYDVSCVTAACLLVRKSIYFEVGGMEEKLAVAFNDVDFCLKIREKGYLIVYDAEAKLHHYESKSRGAENTPEKFMRFSQESETLGKRWGYLGCGDRSLCVDPYYNPNFSYILFFTPDYER